MSILHKFFLCNQSSCGGEINKILYECFGQFDCVDVSDNWITLK